MIPIVYFYFMNFITLIPCLLPQEIMVGSMYQAKIPPLTPHLNHEKGEALPFPLPGSHRKNIWKSCVFLLVSSSAYSGEDQLLWTPDALPAQDVEDFLLNAQRLCGQQGAVWTQEATIKDNEQVRNSSLPSTRFSVTRKNERIWNIYWFISFCKRNL